MLQTFLLRRDLRVALDHNALSEEFFLSARAAYFLEGGLSLIDKVCAKGAEADLDKGAIEENLGADWEVGNCFLEMRHQ